MRARMKTDTLLLLYYLLEETNLGWNQEESSLS
jgi:hypothetical protein